MVLVFGDVSFWLMFISRARFNFFVLSGLSYGSSKFTNASHVHDLITSRAQCTLFVHNLCTSCVHLDLCLNALA